MSVSTMLICPECGVADIQRAGVGQYRCKRCAVSLALQPLPGVDMIHCPDCQAVVMNDETVCHQCGAKLQALVAVRPCPACQQSILVTSAWPMPEICPYCGVNIGAFLTSAFDQRLEELWHQQRQLERRRQRHAIAWRLLTLGLVGLVSALLLVMVKEVGAYTFIPLAIGIAFLVVRAIFGVVLRQN